MKAWLRGFFYSFPCSTVISAFQKIPGVAYFLVCFVQHCQWTFMRTFGADSLYLAPEYLGNVNALGAGIVGIAIGMFIMSWNIASFILFSRHFRFLAATTNPFLRYCINNFVIPLAFLFFILLKHGSLSGIKNLFLLRNI